MPRVDAWASTRLIWCSCSPTRPRRYWREVEKSVDCMLALGGTFPLSVVVTGCTCLSRPAPPTVPHCTAHSEHCRVFRNPARALIVVALDNGAGRAAVDAGRCSMRRAIWLNQSAAVSTTEVLSCLLTARMCRPMQPSDLRRRNGSMKMKKHPPRPHQASRHDALHLPVPYRSVPGATDTLALPTASQNSALPSGRASGGAPLIPAATLACSVCRASILGHRTPVAGALPATSSSGYNVF